MYDGAGVICYMLYHSAGLYVIWLCALLLNHYDQFNSNTPMFHTEKWTTYVWTRAWQTTTTHTYTHTHTKKNSPTKQMFDVQGKYDGWKKRIYMQMLTY